MENWAAQIKCRHYENSWKAIMSQRKKKDKAPGLYYKIKAWQYNNICFWTKQTTGRDSGRYPGDTSGTCRSSSAPPGGSWRTSSHTAGRGSPSHSWKDKARYSETVGTCYWTLLARLFPDDAVEPAPPPVHTVVRYRALAAIQGAPASLPVNSVLVVCQ